MLRWPLVAIANILLLAAIALAFEAFFWATDTHFPSLRYGDRSQDLWLSDPSKGWFHRPNFTTELNLGGPDRGVLHTNALGFRGPEVSLRKSSGTRRVLVVGDSYVFGIGVDTERTLPALLARHLNAGRREAWEVINLGVNSYSTDQELILFGEVGPQLEPDVVVLVVCDNDFEANTLDFVHKRYYKPYFVLSPDGVLTPHQVRVPDFSPWQKVKLWLGQRSNVWNAFRSRRSDIPWIRRGLELFQVATPMPRQNSEMELTAALVVAMRDLAERLGSRFVMLNTAHRGERTQQMQELRRLLRPQGVSFLGLEGHLGEARRRHPERHWDFEGDAHWNVDAQELVARVAFSLLVTEGFLDPR